VGFLSRVISLRTLLNVRGSIAETTADEAEALDSRKSQLSSRKPDDTWHAPSADTDTDTDTVTVTDTDTDTRQMQIQIYKTKS